MKWLKRSAIFIALAFVGFVVLNLAAAEATGEVVVLTTTNEQGNPEETRLWIVDNDGEAWLRAGGERSAWYRRILQDNSVTLMRHGSLSNYTAVPVPAATDTISRLMREKYTWGDTLASKIVDRSVSIAVRLEPPN